MKENKNILITGGTGFIGSNLIRKLIELDFNISVIGLDNLKNSKIADLNDKIIFYQSDLSNKYNLGEILKKSNPAIIIHLASLINLERDNLLVEKLMKNFEITLNIYNGALNLKDLKGIINLGSAEEYGGNIPPFRESQKETPTSPYSLSKTCINYLSSYFYRIHNLPIVTLRPFVVYGEYQTNHQLIPQIISKCLRNEPIETTLGNQTRDFIYVQDLVNAILKIIQNPHKALWGETINICSGEEVKIRDIILKIKQETNSNSEIKFGAIDYRNGESMNFFGSNEKAKLLLDWELEYSFEEGLKKTIIWNKNQF
jgi:nucleoside-diphosphate-sugar epimerase